MLCSVLVMVCLHRLKVHHVRMGPVINHILKIILLHGLSGNLI